MNDVPASPLLHAARDPHQRALRGRGARAQPHVHLPVRGREPQGRCGRGAWRRGSRRACGAGARRCSAVAIEEMGHLAAVWNITSALGGSPRFGRTNFPLDPGYCRRASPWSSSRPSTPRRCSTSCFSSGRTARRSTTAAALPASVRYVRGTERRAPDPDGARLRHGRRLLRRPRRGPARLRGALRRGERLRRRRGAAALARGGESAGRAPGASV